MRLVKDAGAALAEIVESSTSVAAALADISSASTEQANGIGEVAKVVAQMDDMTQRNSSMAEQSAGVARELQQATDELRRMVERFSIGGAPTRTLDASIRAELREMAPHMAPVRAAATRAAPPRLPAAAATTRRAAETGWSEF